MPRADGRAVKAGAGHQHHAADAGGGRRAAGFADAVDGKRCRLRCLGARFQHVDAGHGGIEQIEIGKGVREQSRVGEAGELVVGRSARHGDGAFGQRIEAVAVEVVGRNRRLLMADQDAQADVVALGALQFLDRAVAHLDRKRDRAHGDRIGLVGAGAPRGADEALGKIGEGGLVEQRGHLRLAIGLWGLASEDKTARSRRRIARKMCVQRARFNPDPEIAAVAATSRQSCSAVARATTTP